MARAILSDELILQWPQLYQYISNLSVSDLETEVVKEKLEDDSEQRKCVLHCFPLFLCFLIVDTAQHSNIDAPEKIVYNIVKKCSNMGEQLKDAHIDWFVWVEKLVHAVQFINEFQKLEDFSGWLHWVFCLESYLDWSTEALKKPLSDFRNFWVFVTGIVEVCDVLKQTAYLIPSLACFHDHAEGRHVRGNVFTIGSRQLRLAPQTVIEVLCEVRYGFNTPLHGIL